MCDCCELIERMTDTDNYYVFYAVINRVSYKNLVKNGSVLSDRYPLNYCPECGKKL